MDGLAQFVWTYYNVALGIGVPEVSAADIFYVSAVILFAIGFSILLVHGIRPKLPRWAAAILSVLAVAFSVALPFLIFGMFPRVEGAILNLDSFYTAASFAIVLIVAINIYRDEHAELRPYLFCMLISFSITGLGDALFGVRDFLGIYWNGDSADGLYALGALGFLSCYGLLPSALTHAVMAGEPRRLRLGLPGLFALSFALAGFVIAGGIAGLVYTDHLQVAEDKMRLQTLQVSEVLQVSFARTRERVQALAGFFEGSAMVTEGEFRQFTSGMTEDGEAVGSLWFIGLDNRVRFSTDDVILGMEYGREAQRGRLLAQAREEDRVIVSEPLILFEGAPGILIAAPVRRGGIFIGMAMASIRLPAFLGAAEEFVTEHADIVFQLKTPERLIALDGHDIYDLSGRRILDSSGRVSAAPLAGVAAQDGPLAFTDAVFIDGVTWFLTATLRPGVFRGAFAVALAVFLSVVAAQSILSVFMYFVLVQQSRLRREAERIQNQFIALVSHQLRAPMTHLRWMLEQLKEQPRLPKNVQEQLASMEGIVLAENRLVGDLLNVSRIGRGVLTLDLADVPVSTLLSDAVKPLEKTARDRHVRVVLPEPPADVLVRVDREKITEAIRNLVDNAIKYGPEHGTVTLAAEEENSRFAVLSVSDQGFGIPEEQWPALFEIKTAPLTSPLAGGLLGTGLGLYIAKKFIDAVGGEIRFETSLKGTTFFLRLPRSKGTGQKQQEQVR